MARLRRKFCLSLYVYNLHMLESHFIYLFIAHAKDPVFHLHKYIVVRKRY